MLLPVYRIFLNLGAIYWPRITIKICSTMNVFPTIRPDIDPLSLSLAYKPIISTCRIDISHHEVILCRRLMGLVARGISIITEISILPCVATGRNIIIRYKSFYICLRVNPPFPYIIHIFAPLEWFTFGHTHQAQNKHTTLKRCHTYELKYVM